MRKQLLVGMLLSFLLAACGSSGASSNSTGSLSGGWVHSYSHAVEYFQLTVNGSQVTGQEQEEYATNDTPPQTHQSSSTVSGTFNGTQVTLTFSIYGFPVRTYAGTYENNTLTLTVPDQNGNLQSIQYQPASTDDYNNAVQQLQQSVNQQVQNYDNAVATATMATYQQQVAEATAAAISDEQQRLSYDLNNIGGAISQLANETESSSLLGSYNRDISTMQSAYQTEQADANGGCANLGQVGADNGQVDADQGQIAADDGQLQAQLSSVQNDIAGVQDFVQKIQQHWNNLGQQPFSGVSADDVNKAIKNGNDAINQANSNLQSAQSQASNFDKQAGQITQQAQSLYDGMHC
ncbi:MAG TPA: hypothetical protein VF026_30280 [Ktedonobacteraceae bacterium]